MMLRLGLAVVRAQDCDFDPWKWAGFSSKHGRFERDYPLRLCCGGKILVLMQPFVMFFGGIF